MKKEVIKENRVWLLDNLKVILIFLVVYGHLLEIGINDKTKFLYIMIYLFHIPAFAFCSGYFSNDFDSKKIIKRMIIPYIVFQTLYCIFDSIYLKGTSNIALNYTTPYWIMWYLFATIVWNIILQFINTNSLKKQNIIIISLFVLGLLVGLDNTIGYYLSLSRILTFLPFFIIGFYTKKNIDLIAYKEKINKKWKLIIYSTLALIFLGIAMTIWTNLSSFVPSFLYGSYSYKSLGYGISFRLIQYIIAVLMLIMLLWFIPNKKYIFSHIGKYTLSIYLLHGFITKILQKEMLINLNKSNYLLVVEYFIITIFLILCLPLISIIKDKVFISIKKIYNSIKSRV